MLPATLQGHGVCDHNDFERRANILTSLPYLAIGLHTLRSVFTAAGAHRSLPSPITSPCSVSTVGPRHKRFCADTLLNSASGAQCVMPMSPHASDTYAAEGARLGSPEVPAAGLHGRRKRQTPEGRWYGASLLGVGVGSITYHSSAGSWRAAGRKIDYWAISAASAALVS